MNFKPGFDIDTNHATMDFIYGKGVFGPVGEKRKLDDIRSSLSQPDCTGPETLYSIVMDVGDKEDLQNMIERNLLFGVVTYAKGQVGNEPVRSQGHIHAISPSCNASTCEVYEIWEGSAYIYMQASGSDHAGNCYAILAQAGDVVVVPPGWVHATINANIDEVMTFGAWCVRDFGFDYQDVKAHGGIAFFPIVKDGKITWEKNPHYASASLHVKQAFAYPQFGIEQGKAIYTQFKEDPDRFLFVSKPQINEAQWKEFK